MLSCDIKNTVKINTQPEL